MVAQSSEVRVVFDKNVNLILSRTFRIKIKYPKTFPAIANLGVLDNLISV